MKEARKNKIEDMRNRKNDNNEKIPLPPKLKRSKAVDMKQEIIKSSSSESSTSTDSSNYESDEKTEKIIIYNYHDKEPESKLIMKKVRRKNKINHEELKKIYDEVNKEERKNRKKKVENIKEFDDRPKRKRAPAKPRKQQQQQQPKQDIPIIYYI